MQMVAARGKKEADETSRTRRFVFLLLERFTMISFAGAIEPLRIANRMLRRPAYSWVLAGENGKDVTCSNGTAFHVDVGLVDVDREDMIFVCGGMDIQQTTTKAALNWLRREARRGVAVAGLCTGSYTMAKAGLLDGKRATIHWENQDSFLEEFEEVRMTKQVFVIDGNRMSTAGGTSSLDLMLKIIAADALIGIGAIYGPIRPETKSIGSSAATTVSVAMIVGLPTSATDSSTMSTTSASGVGPPSSTSPCIAKSWRSNPRSRRSASSNNLSPCRRRFFNHCESLFLPLLSLR